MPHIYFIVMGHATLLGLRSSLGCCNQLAAGDDTDQQLGVGVLATNCCVNPSVIKLHKCIQLLGYSIQGPISLHAT